MCDPIMLLSAAVAGGGKLYEGLAGSSAHSRSAALAESNAELLRTQGKTRELGADIAVTRGNYDEFLSRRKVSHVLASETAHFASGNVDPTYGSPLMVQGFSAAQGETDAQLIRARMMGERADVLTSAANIYGQAYQQTARAEVERSSAQTSLISGVLGAATSLLSTASKWTSLGGTSPTGASEIGSFISPAGSNPFMLNGSRNVLAYGLG